MALVAKIAKTNYEKESSRDEQNDCRKNIYHHSPEYSRGYLYNGTLVALRGEKPN